MVLLHLSSLPSGSEELCAASKFGDSQAPTSGLNPGVPPKLRLSFPAFFVPLVVHAHFRACVLRKRVGSSQVRPEDAFLRRR